MVKINLLPIEKRRPERTPLPRFLAIVGGVGLVISLVFFLLWMKFIWIANAREDLDARNADYGKPMTQEILKKYDTLKAQKDTFDSRAATIDKLKPPFRWTDVLDLLCDKLETPHKKIWFDEIKVFEPNDLRMKQQETGFPVESGLVVDGHAVSANPEGLLTFRYDIMQPAKKAEGASAQKTRKAIIDYFAGGINRSVSFTLKDQNDYEEGASQNFKTEYYIKAGAKK
jgi:hypothetical protein